MVQYTTQNNFNGGILSKDIQSRSDIAPFPISVADAENFMLTTEGVAIKRRGSKFVAKAKSRIDKKVILIQYSFSDEKNYMLEMGNGYVRFYKNLEQIMESNGIPYEISSPYDEEDIPNLKFVFQNKKIYFVSGQDFPQVLSTNGDTDWYFSQQELDGPYFTQRWKDTEPKIELKWTKVNPDANGEGYQGEINNINSTINIFYPSDVGRSIQFYSADNITDEVKAINNKFYHSVVITKYIDPKNVYGKWLRPAIGEEKFDDGEKARVFHFSIFGYPREPDGTEGDLFIPIGFPSVIGTHENRLIFANSPNAPSQRWGSCIEPSKQTKNIDSVDCFYSIIDGFVTPNDLAYSYDLKSNSLTSIQWLVEENGLIIETSKDEISVGSSWYSNNSSEDRVTPNSSGKMRKNSSEGSNKIQGILFGNKVIFVSRSGKKLLSIKHDLSSGKYEVSSLSQLSKDLLQSGITSICGQRDLDPRIYCSIEDGTMPVLLENEKEKVRGWTRYTTDGEYLYANTLPSYSADKKSELWVVCKRSNRNEEFLSIEVMQDEDTVTTSENRNLLPYSDCSIVHNGALTSTFSNLQIFEGKKIFILADGKVHPSIRVVNGSVTLDYAANVAIFGLPYFAYLTTLDFRVLSQDSYQSTTQLSLMLKRTILNANIRFSDSINAVVGVSKGSLYTIPFRTSYDNPLGSLPLFNGSKEVTIDNENDEHSSIVVGSETPTPMTINVIGLNISPE